MNVQIKINILHFYFQLKGRIDDCSCNVDTVDHFNNMKIYPILSSLLNKDYFRFYRVWPSYFILQCFGIGSLLLVNPGNIYFKLYTTDWMAEVHFLAWVILVFHLSCPVSYKLGILEVSLGMKITVAWRWCGAINKMSFD